MHYQSLNAALEQYSSSLTHHPTSPNSLALHIDRQTPGCLKTAIGCSFRRFRAALRRCRASILPIAGAGFGQGGS